MAEHVWKIGDWCEYDKKRCLITRVTTDCDGAVRVWGVGKDPFLYRFETSLLPTLKHLPDCDSWDWQPTPKLQLREGAWYERADGEVVGPSRIVGLDFYVGGRRYNASGSGDSADKSLDLIREVPAPVPKYRQFANAKEFKPHRDRWIRDKSSWAVRVTSLNDNGANGSSWESLVKNYTFEDTGLPVGVEVSS